MGNTLVRVAGYLKRNPDITFRLNSMGFRCRERCDLRPVKRLRGAKRIFRRYIPGGQKGGGERQGIFCDDFTSFVYMIRFVRVLDGVAWCTRPASQSVGDMPAWLSTCGHNNSHLTKWSRYSKTTSTRIPNKIQSCFLEVGGTSRIIPGISGRRCLFLFFSNVILM